MAAKKNTQTTTAKSAAKSATKSVKSTRPTKKVEASITLTAPMARAILAPYRETDNIKARKVTSLIRFTGKGHTADSIIRDTLSAADTAGIAVPSGFGTSEVGLALSVARAMATVEVAVTTSARDGIAAALVDIHRVEKTHGGGKTGVEAALESVKGIANGAEIAAALTAHADAITATRNAARRARAALKTRVARPIEPTDATDDGADTAETAQNEAKRTGSEAAVSLADVTFARLIHEVDRRVVGGYVLTLAELAAFEVLAQNVELTMVDVDA